MDYDDRGYGDYGGEKLSYSLNIWCGLKLS